MHHYRNYRCLVNGAIRISDTVDFHPVTYQAPTISHMDQLNMHLDSLTTTLQQPKIKQPILESPQLIDAVSKLRTILDISPTSEPPKTAPSPRVNNPDPRVDTTGHKQLYKIGTIIKKKFKNKFHEGEATSFDKKEGWYHINYQDGDSEDMDNEEIKEHYNKNQ